MLPIALTCPLWWVARWTARMLASLAVVVACSFGAATLPLGTAATAQAASHPVDGRRLPIVQVAQSVAALPGHALRPVIHWSGPALAAATAPSARLTRAASAPAVGVVGSRATDVSILGPGGSDRELAGFLAVGGPASAAQRSAEVIPAQERPVPVGLTPATVGSRAPPAR
ncbi:hypothetical protein ACGFI9_24970 [Micromonospora sp. NPDC048930]|uniref:hypothetical protein n=1 Tax=Micromonospora sp. NPDC048930 TaxID=3364261 RepID=UPI00372433C1